MRTVLFLYLLLNLPNFLNGLVHLPVLELSIINVGDIKMKIWIWSANSIKPGQADLALYYLKRHKWSQNFIFIFFWKHVSIVLVKIYWYSLTIFFFKINNKLNSIPLLHYDFDKTSIKNTQFSYNYKKWYKS